MRTRSLAALSALAVSAVLLAGCSSPAAEEVETEETPSGEASTSICDSAVAEGDISDAIVTEGGIGEAITVSFDGPLEIVEAQRTVEITGDGPAIEDGDLIEYGLSIFDPATGELVASEGYDNDGLPVAVTYGSGIDQFFGCEPLGSRIVMALPATESSEAAVWVFDVIDVAPTRAWGADQAPVEGMPTVVLDDEGSPTVRIPDTDAPTEVEIAVLKEGDGPVVTETSGVTLQYAGYAWSTGEEFDSSWTKGAPITHYATGFVPGFNEALAGQKVGSQILVVIPPEFGYGAAEGHDLQNETLVFVIDILAAASYDAAP